MILYKVPLPGGARGGLSKRKKAKGKSVIHVVPLPGGARGGLSKLYKTKGNIKSDLI